MIKVTTKLRKIAHALQTESVKGFKNDLERACYYKNLYLYNMPSVPYEPQDFANLKQIVWLLSYYHMDSSLNIKERQAKVIENENQIYTGDYNVIKNVLLCL